MRVLYLTYDGITSLIGQSQVLPYLKGLSEAGHSFHAISFEHADRLAAIGNSTARELERHRVSWHPRPFRTRPPVLAKLIDQWDMRTTARRLAASGRFDFTHARSYVAADVALELKRRFSLPYVFDMRGFWPNQKREGGHWPQSRLFYRLVYRHWKAKEASLIAGAAHIVVLAEAARRVIESWDCYRGQPITAIPCSVDHDAFTLRTPEARSAARAGLGIPADATVLAYLGSLGTVYLLDDMLRFYGRLREARPGARFLFIGRHSAQELAARAQCIGIDAGPDEFPTRFAEHGDVPRWLAAADLAIGLVKPGFSNHGVSMTKFGEYLACGLPVVVNDGVGDAGSIVERLGAGAVLRDLSDTEIDRAAGLVDAMLGLDPAGIRARSREIHGMEVALRSYASVYESIGGAQRG